jgi:hypothetical protein
MDILKAEIAKKRKLLEEKKILVSIIPPQIFPKLCHTI